MVGMDRRSLARHAAEISVRRFGKAPDWVAVAPGRVELLGNHTDYNEGLVLTAAVEAATAVAVSPRADRIVRLHSDHPAFADAETDLESPIRAEGSRRWINYVLGVAREFALSGADLPGADLVFASTVPDGSGVSSSAALLVATARAFEALAGLAPMAPMEIAKLCRRAENGPFVGAPVGLLDQFSSACGRGGNALLLDCRSLEWRVVPLPELECSLLIANTGIRHELAAGGGYADRRSACFRVAQAATGSPDASLRDVSLEDIARLEGHIDSADLRRARHVLEENVRVRDGAEALARRDWARFGSIMVDCHASCRDLFENSCPEVDLLVETALAAGAHGAKLTGGGWGGAAIVLHSPASGPAIREALVSRWSARFGGEPVLMATAAADGAMVARWPE